MLPNKIHLHPEAITGAFILISFVVFLGLIGGNGTDVSAAERRQSEDTETHWSVDVREDAPKNLSPAQAMSSGKPSVFYFYPVDTCRIRYCRQPFEIGEDLNRDFGEQINFVAVALNTISYGPDPNVSPNYPLSAWDIYPVAPYSDWLPDGMLTAAEEGSVYASVVLVDADGRASYKTGEFFQWEELVSSIERILVK